jgi:hypothetical protein
MQFYDSSDVLGLNAQRLRRCRLRLKGLYRLESVEAILMHMSRRFSKIRVRHARPDWDLRGEVVPLYEAAGL